MEPEASGVFRACFHGGRGLTLIYSSSFFLLSCAFFFSGNSKRMAAFFTMNLVIFFSVRSPSYLRQSHQSRQCVASTLILRTMLGMRTMRKIIMRPTLTAHMTLAMLKAHIVHAWNARCDRYFQSGSRRLQCLNRCGRFASCRTARRP